MYISIIYGSVVCIPYRIVQHSIINISPLPLPLLYYIYRFCITKKDASTSAAKRSCMRTPLVFNNNIYY